MQHHGASGSLSMPAPHACPHPYPCASPSLQWLTQAVEAEGSIVAEVADMAGARRHGAEGVGAAGGKGVEADKQQVDEQGPVVGFLAEV